MSSFVPGIKTLDIDPEKCSPQCLSLMLGVYLKPKILFLLGYDLLNPIEFTRLKSIAISNPDIRFAYICNPPVTKRLEKILMFYNISEEKNFKISLFSGLIL